MNDRVSLLMELCLDGKVDETDILNLPCVKKVEVVPIPLIKCRRDLVKKCRNLKLFNGWDVKLDQFLTAPSVSKNF